MWRRSAGDGPRLLTLEGVRAALHPVDLPDGPLIAGLRPGSVRLLRLAWIAFVVVGIVSAMSVAIVHPIPDLWAYWEAGRRWPDIYGWAGGINGPAFLYPPTSAFVFAPLANIPLPALRIAWVLVDIGLLRWALGSWRLVLIVAPLPPITTELLSGNVNILAGAFLLRAPWANALLLGFAPKPMIAILALAGGRRSVAIACIVAVVLMVGVGLDGWRWLDLLRHASGSERGALSPIDFGWAYFPWALAWLAVAARWRHKATLALAAAFAAPVIHAVYFTPFVMTAVVWVLGRSWPRVRNDLERGEPGTYSGHLTRIDAAPSTEAGG